MSKPFVLPLEVCKDPALVGSKAASLGRLLRHGFHVPPGFCLTTAAYLEALHDLGINPDTHWEQVRAAPDSSRDDLLKEIRHRIETIPIAQVTRWMVDCELLRTEHMIEAGHEPLCAVRSSASHEDTPSGTFAGVYRTSLGIPRSLIASAVVGCWASMWTPTAFAYHNRSPFTRTTPAMAVLVQPLLSPLASGVAYSCHPVTGRSDIVTINSVYGLAEPLVGGHVTPDHFEVQADIHSHHLIIIERNIVGKTSARVATHTGLIDQPLPSDDHHKPSLNDRGVLSLARLTRQVERDFGRAMDIEWAMDDQGIWLLQARPISHNVGASGLTESACVWSRANFKETLPEVPSPLGLSFFREFVESNIVRHYRELGCIIPHGLSSLRVIRGRPYINLTLFQSFIAQLAGDPTHITDQMGGQPHPVPIGGPPRMTWWKLLRAGVLAEWKIRRAARRAPAWFAEMKQMGQAADHSIAGLSPVDLRARMDRLGKRLHEGDMTFAIVAGVSQGFQALNWLFERRIGAGWRSILNASLQGLGNVISAKQILWLVELAEQAGEERIVREFLSEEPWKPDQFRIRLAGTRFLRAFDDYMSEYGHRGLAESDVISPRFAEIPDYVLGVIRGHLLTPGTHSAASIRREQESARRETLQRIRSAFGWRWHERAFFNWWHRRLARYLALREANRHHLMYFTAAVRRLTRMIGERLAAAGILQFKDDMFFLTADEMDAVVGGNARDWKSLVMARRAEQAENARHAAPDSLIGLTNAIPPVTPGKADATLIGLPISAGCAEGPVRLVLSQEGAREITRGDILVVSVIDPGLAPVLGMAAGLIVEMGGILSHGAIIAREYGIPAVANVPGVTRLLKDGERVAVDAGTGEIRRLDRECSLTLVPFQLIRQNIRA